MKFIFVGANESLLIFNLIILPGPGQCQCRAGLTMFAQKKLRACILWKSEHIKRQDHPGDSIM